MEMLQNCSVEKSKWELPGCTQRERNVCQDEGYPSSSGCAALQCQEGGIFRKTTAQNQFFSEHARAAKGRGRHAERMRLDGPGLGWAELRDGRTSTEGL